ncbi:MAG: DedA family protein [Patescibacteria group bacterium]
MDAFLQQLLFQFPFLADYQYLLFFLGGALEGLNTMILAGFLASLGLVDAVPIIAVLIVAYWVNGFLWYAVGYFGGARPIDYWLRHNQKRRRIFELTKKYFEAHTGKAIVVTKTTLSLTIVTLILAGSLRYDLKKFSWYNFLGSVGWVLVTFWVGYFFGESFEFAFAYVRNISHVILFFVAAVLVVYLLRRTSGMVFNSWLAFTERVKEVGQAVKESIDEIVPISDETDHPQ